MCGLRWLAIVQEKLHFLQANVFLPVCESRWYFVPPECLQEWLHCLHAMRFFQYVGACTSSDHEHESKNSYTTHNWMPFSRMSQHVLSEMTRFCAGVVTLCAIERFCSGMGGYVHHHPNTSNPSATSSSSALSVRTMYIYREPVRLLCFKFHSLLREQ